MFVKFNIKKKKIVMSKCNGILLHCTVELDFAPKKKLQKQNPGNFSIMMDISS